jgi:DnaJ-class molecular chaperone
MSGVIFGPDDESVCPTCGGEGVEFLGDDDDIGDACPDCGGEGTA